MKVSVIIPSYNNAHCISKAITSAINQIEVKKEVIVIDDGSNDDIEKLIKCTFPEVKFIKQTNQGPATARNKGFINSTGDYIAFLDADDFWEPTFLKECLDFLLRNKECVAVSVGSRFIYANNTEKIRPNFLLEPNTFENQFVINDFYKFWAKNDHIFTGSCLIRRSAIIDIGLMREDLRIAEDLEYWALLATIGKWGFISSILWNCNSQKAIAITGWRKKNKLRWENTPTIESWESRIIKFIKPQDVIFFNEYKGKLILTFLYNMILGGNENLARLTIKTNSKILPNSKISNLYKLVSRQIVLWKLFCIALRYREFNKY